MLGVTEEQQEALCSLSGEHSRESSGDGVGKVGGAGPRGSCSPWKEFRFCYRRRMPPEVLDIAVAWSDGFYLKKRKRDSLCGQWGECCRGTKNSPEALARVSVRHACGWDQTEPWDGSEQWLDLGCIVKPELRTYWPDRMFDVRERKALREPCAWLDLWAPSDVHSTSQERKSWLHDFPLF